MVFATILTTGAFAQSEQTEEPKQSKLRIGARLNLIQGATSSLSPTGLAGTINGVYSFTPAWEFAV